VVFPALALSGHPARAQRRLPSVASAKEGGTSLSLCRLAINDRAPGEILANQEGLSLIEETLGEEKNNGKLTALADTIELLAAFLRNFGVECFSYHFIGSGPANALIAVIV
jgi:hypothetical protein